MDQGIVIYQKKGHEYVAHCICQAGEVFNSKKAYIPAIDTIMDVEQLARSNIEEWVSVYKRNPRAIQELKELGISAEQKK